MMKKEKSPKYVVRFLEKYMPSYNNITLSGIKKDLKEYGYTVKKDELGYLFIYDSQNEHVGFVENIKSL